MATADTVVRARINGRIKNEASIVLAAMGLTVSDAFRLLLTRVAQDKNLPFTPLVPNKKTIAALEASRRGDMTSVKSRKALFEQLDAED
jgi:DNA-damage-inducible protein J